jgi:hypothetical protein
MSDILRRFLPFAARVFLLSFPKVNVAQTKIEHPFCFASDKDRQAKQTALYKE